MISMLKRLVTLGAVAVIAGGLFLTVGGAGAAYADHPNGAFSDVNTRDDMGNAPHPGPVGSTHLSADAMGNQNWDDIGQGSFNGVMYGFGATGEPGDFVLGGIRGGIGILNNPNCPLHWPSP